MHDLELCSKIDRMTYDLCVCRQCSPGSFSASIVVTVRSPSFTYPLHSISVFSLASSLRFLLSLLPLKPTFPTPTLLSSSIRSTITSQRVPSLSTLGSPPMLPSLYHPFHFSTSALGRASTRVEALLKRLLAGTLLYYRPCHRLWLSHNSASMSG